MKKQRTSNGKQWNPIDTERKPIGNQLIKSITKFMESRRKPKESLRKRVQFYASCKNVYLVAGGTFQIANQRKTAESYRKTHEPLMERMGNYRKSIRILKEIYGIPHEIHGTLKAIY